MGKVNKNELPRSQAKIHIKEKKYKRAIKGNRLRPLKNFLFWLFGVLSSIGIVFGSVFVALKVIPMSTIVGKDNLNGVVSENVADDSLVDFILNFKNYGFGDFPIIEQSLNDALEGKEFGILSKYQHVDTPELIPTTVNGATRYATSEGVDSTKYYCESQPSGFSGMSQSDEKTYVRAFDDNGLLIPALSEKVRNNEQIELYYQPLTNLPVMQALGSIGEYIQFVPVSDILSIVGVNGDTLVNSLFTGIDIGDFMKSPEDGGFSMETMLDRLSIETLGGAELLGDLGNFSFFAGYEAVADKPEVVDGFIKKDGENFTSNPALYYVLVRKAAVEGEQDIYARAFTDDGEFITEYYVDENGNVYNQKKGTETPALAFNDFSQVTDLRYANLSKAPFSQALNLIGESITRQSITGLFSSLGSDVEEGSLISDLFGEYTIADFTKPAEEGGFDINTVQLTKLLGEQTNENKQLYDLLCSVVQSEEKLQAEDLTIGHLLGGLSFDGIIVSEHITLDTDTLDLLCSAINPAKRAEYESNLDNTDSYKVVEPSTLTIGDFKYFNQDDIKMSTILGNYESSKELYDVILSAKKEMPEKQDGESQTDYDSRVKDKAENLTISSLSGLKPQDIKLTVVLEETDNEQLYEILLSVLNITDDANNIITNPVATDIKIAHLKGFNAGKIKLSTVLELPSENSKNETIYKILSEATGQVDYSKITVADLNGAESGGFDINNVKLSSVLRPEKDEKLYEVLAEIYPDIDVKKELTIAELSDFDVSGVKLKTVLPQDANPEIYKVFGDALNLEGVEGKTTAEQLGNVSLKEIEERLNIQHIHLSTVLGKGYKEDGTFVSTNNALLDALLKVNVTVGDISTSIDSLSLYEIYGEKCFKEDATTPGDKYVRTEDDGVVTYTLDASGTYMIDTTSGMWLLWCYDVPEGCTDITGRATKYVSSNTTMDTLQSGGSAISDKIVNATIRQLVTAGVIDDGEGFHESMYPLTISGVLEKLNEMLSGGLMP